MSKSVPEVILKIGVLTNESMTLSKKTVHVVGQSAPDSSKICTFINGLVNLYQFMNVTYSYFILPSL